MLASQELREYERSSSELRTRRVDIKLKNHDAHLLLDVPDYGVVPRQNPTLSSSKVLQVHTEFKKILQPDLAQDSAFYKRCAAEVNVINLFFPDIKSEGLRICFTAWLVFIIAMDDILETLPPLDGEAALVDSIQIVLSLPEQKRDGALMDTRIQGLTRVLYRHCTQWLCQKTARSFFKTACKVFRAHIDEVRFMHGQIPNDLPTYMGIREITIALNPFFTIIKNEFLPEGRSEDTIWDELETEVCRATGLQNDLIGLERDLENGEPLNAVIVLLASNGSPVQEQGEELFARYIEKICAEHNRSTTRAKELLAQINQEIDVADSKGAAEVARHIIMMCETHLKWCTTAKRYSMKSDEEPSIPNVS
ncbi:isoprenoid synthase domain-containing protein [Nemania abortiva]|nr:isoprenoid synthase domain-containing protein [Nemania abortiva]